MVGALQTIETRKTVREEEITIFIVDEEESSLAALGYRLKKENPFRNYKVHCFSSGEECIKHFHLKPDLIIMDQYLVCADDGSLCGTSLIRKIRKLNSEIPLVIVSGKRKPHFNIEGENDDSWYYLVKDQTAYDSVRKILGMMKPSLVH